MIITHSGYAPQIDPTAYVAPNAVICGDVIVGSGCRIMFGAQVIVASGSSQGVLDGNSFILTGFGGN